MYSSCQAEYCIVTTGGSDIARKVPDWWRFLALSSETSTLVPTHSPGNHFDTLQCTEYRPSQQYNNFEWLFQANHSTENSSDSVHTFSYTSYDDLFHQSSTDFSHTQHTSPNSCSIMGPFSCFSNTLANVLLLLLLIEIVTILSFIHYSILVQVKSQAHQTLQQFWRLFKAAISCLLANAANSYIAATHYHYDVQSTYLNKQQKKYGLSIYERATYYAIIYTEGSQSIYMEAAHYVALHLFDILQAIATVPQPMRFLCAQPGIAATRPSL